MKIFITTDTHFGHDALHTKIKSRPRDFQQRIIRQWESHVQADDLVIHLGDVVVGPSKIWSLLPELPGRKILVMGNHDGKPIRWYMEHGFDFCCNHFTWEMYG